MSPHFEAANRRSPAPSGAFLPIEGKRLSTVAHSGMQEWHEDTIAAIATATGPGAIGIVRMSGPQSLSIAERVFRPARGQTLRPDENYRLIYGRVFDPADGQDVDEVLMAVMRSPRSYTREDVVEFHCHGGLVAQRSVLRLLVSHGARLAEPGEFTRRAFLNGRIDLAQAESVAAIVAARSTGALRASVRQLDGGLSDRLRVARRELISVLAQIEATVDFSDEDVEPVDWRQVTAALERVESNLQALLRTAFVGKALEHGVRTAIVGRPNVGKSSLLNALLMRERAIVSDVPGTTRDTVEELLEIGGIPIHLIDTAGIRRGGDQVEQLGVERSLRAMEQADLTLVVIDLSECWDEVDCSLVKGLDPARSIVVANKVDLVADPNGRLSALLAYLSESCQGRVETRRNGGGTADPRGDSGSSSDSRSAGAGGAGVGEGPEKPPGMGSWRCCAVSAQRGDGLEELRGLIQDIVSGGEGFHLEEPVLASERQRALVAEAAEAVKAARAGIDSSQGEELVCEDVREAAQALGRITGEELTPDLLDQIFSRFCIGK